MRALRCDLRWKAAGGLGLLDAAATVACPAGHTTPLGRPQAHGHRQDQFRTLCRTCPRDRCATSQTGRTLTIHPKHALLAAARHEATDPAWPDEYRRWRPRSNAGSPG